MSVKRRERAYPVGSQPGLDEPYQNSSSRYPPADRAASSQQYESPVIPDYNPQSRNSSSNTTGLARHLSVKKSDSQRYSAAARAAKRYSGEYRSPVPRGAPNIPKTRAGPDDVTYDHRRIASEPMSTSDVPRADRRYEDGPVRPTVQTEGLEPRRGSIPHKSPLQKLEVTLDGISKEEKRSRIEEAERKAAQRGHRSSSGKQPHSRTVSAPDKDLPHPPIGEHKYAAQNYKSGSAVAAGKQPARGDDAGYRRVSGHSQQAAEYAGRSSGPDRIPAARKALVGAAVAGAAALGTGALRSDYGPPARQFSGRRLQKEPPKDSRYSYGSPTAGQDPRDDGVEEEAGTGSNYHTPPQDATGLGIQGSRVQSGQDEGQEFHPQDEPRRYADEGPAGPSEWKSVPTAKLLGLDLDLVTTPEPSGEVDSKAWWEKNERERTQNGASSSANTPHYKGHYDEKSKQTYFQPHIYLKCGPLLRFRGVHSEKVRSTRSTTAKTREIWKGSVMIVTVDKKSDYSLKNYEPPVLRLFKQPLDLLPPPPTEIDEANGQRLPPEYVDPIAGQVKMSRIGKTLYVRPVENIDPGRDLSRTENDSGLFEERRTAPESPHIDPMDGEKIGKVQEIHAARLYAERGVTFWKFNIEIELTARQERIAYRINKGPAVGFWVPARGESMNIMFHSCNGFSLAANPNHFSGPDPLWRDVLNSHQTRPFHVMIGGGDQIYMDSVRTQTKYFRDWAETKNPHRKHHAEFSEQMQDEVERFFLNRYSMWFSQGFFGMANCQIPMVNIWDDHDIIDGYGSYTHRTMASPVMAGLGAVAFKYYMLFQHQSVPEETEKEEPSWLLGAHHGPYIHQLSRSVFMSMGPHIAFLGLDCRTERTREDVLSEDSWERVWDRLEKELVKGQTKHLIILLGIPIAYPRLNFLENVLTSRAMDPVKFIGRTGVLGGFVNKFDGGVEILDDLDDHWTAKHHKDERNWLIQELQSIAAEKSVRVTILGGDVHLGAVGQFYSRKNLAIPKDRDHRYMPNVISSAIVNTPPSDMVADILNKRNKIHHLDEFTDEDMITMFPHDVDGKPRNNQHLLPRRNWCSIREYHPKDTPPPTPPTPGLSPRFHEEFDDEEEAERPSGIRRSLSLTRRNFTPRAIAQRFSRGGSRNPPMAFYTRGSSGGAPLHQRSSSADAVLRRPGEGSDGYFPASAGATPTARRSLSEQRGGGGAASDAFRPNSFVRRPTDLSEHHAEADAHGRGGHISLEGGLDVRLNAENARGEPEGTTTDFRLLIPALDFVGEPPAPPPPLAKKGGLRRLIGSLRGRKRAGGSVGSYTPSMLSLDHGAHDAHDARTSNGVAAAGAAAAATAAGVAAVAAGARDRDRDSGHNRAPVPHRAGDALQGWTDARDARHPVRVRDEPLSADDEVDGVDDDDFDEVVSGRGITTATAPLTQQEQQEQQQQQRRQQKLHRAPPAARDHQQPPAAHHTRHRDSYPPPSSASPKPRASRAPAAAPAPARAPAPLPALTSAAALPRGADGRIVAGSGGIDAVDHGRPVRRRRRGDQYGYFSDEDDEPEELDRHLGSNGVDNGADSSGGDDAAGRALEDMEARLPLADGGRRRFEFGRIGREMAAAAQQQQRRGRGEERDPADINGAYRDPGSPSARERKRKSSWRFWRID